MEQASCLLRARCPFHKNIEFLWNRHLTCFLTFQQFLNRLANPIKTLTAAVQIAEAVLVQDISVTIEIDHGYLGDLEISIVAPSGDAVLLQGRTLGVKKKLQTTYSMTTTPALQLLLGVGAQGQWQLQVVDAIAGDTGTLRSWQLKLGA